MGRSGAGKSSGSRSGGFSGGSRSSGGFSGGSRSGMGSRSSSPSRGSTPSRFNSTPSYTSKPTSPSSQTSRSTTPPPVRPSRPTTPSPRQSRPTPPPRPSRPTSPPPPRRPYFDIRIMEPLQTPIDPYTNRRDFEEIIEDYVQEKTLTEHKVDDLNSGDEGSVKKSKPYSNRKRTKSHKSIAIAIAAILAFVGIIVSAVLFSSTKYSTKVTSSTVLREALPSGYVNETAYYSDDAGWMSNFSQLESGMKIFYESTGVQPYLAILEPNTSTSTTELTQIAEKMYSELFTDEAHFLLVFCDDELNETYNCGYVVGSQAKTVIDNEAIAVFADYLERNYYSNLTDEEFFSNTYKSTAERIMTVTKSPWIIVAMFIAVILIILILFKWYDMYAKNKAIEAERQVEILNTPLEKFSDLELSELSKKYDDK